MSFAHTKHSIDDPTYPIAFITNGNRFDRWAGDFEHLDTKNNYCKFDASDWLLAVYCSDTQTMSIYDNRIVRNPE